MTLEERNDEVNKALEARFSQLNAALEAHEAKLKAMMVPKDAWFVYKSYDDEQEEGGEYQFCLGMIKLRGAWRLCHASRYVSYRRPDDELYWKPLVEASVEERIAAVEHIDKLRDVIVEAKEKLIPEVEKAIATLANSLEGYRAEQK